MLKAWVDLGLLALKRGWMRVWLIPILQSAGWSILRMELKRDEGFEGVRLWQWV